MMPNHVHLIAVPPMLERYADIGALLEEATQDDTGKIPVCAHSPRERRDRAAGGTLRFMARCQPAR